MDHFDDSSRTLSSESVRSEDFLSDDDLSEEQIDALLRAASERANSAHLAVQTLQRPLSKLPQLKSGTLPTPYVQTVGHIARAEKKALISDEQRSLSEQPKRVVDETLFKKQARQEAKETLSDWYNIPKTDLTPELKRDLQLLNMRSVIDPHRMYKKQGKFKIPEYSQVGVIVEGPTEFYSARLQKRDRKKTFVDSALAGEAQTGRFKKKYDEVQMSKTSGKKAFYNALKAKRTKASKG
ncbi:putative rrna-processing protein fcf2 protein [Venturia nashicola]|nr:putative rrna-processing protein fcf2 protein [Venturia nashicola]